MFRSIVPIGCRIYRSFLLECNLSARSALSTTHVRTFHAVYGSKVPQYLLDRTVPASEILAKLTAEDQERLDFIKAEYKERLESGACVPSSISDNNLLELLCRPSYTGRLGYYTYLFKIEMKNENKHKKKASKVYTPHEDAPVSFTRCIRQIPSTAIRYHCDNWVAAELRCPEAAQPLVFDFSYESEMRIQDQMNLADQMTYVLTTTRKMIPHPFHVILSGLRRGTNQYSFMEKYLHVDAPGSLYTNIESFPWTVTPTYYKELDYPDFKDRPIYYLSPNAPRVFEAGEWDHNAVYVVGALVDKAVRRPVTSSKARRDDVECIRLPLERYFNWGSGRSKTLTLVCLYNILATAKSTNGDWETALRMHLPKRMFVDGGSTVRRISRQIATV